MSLIGRRVLVVNREALSQLDKINAKIHKLNDEHPWTPVFVFATFENSEWYEQAIALDQTIEIGGVKCTLLPAPEPETLVWEHLEYSPKERKQRKW